jgi:hypothetical protein
MLCREVTTLRQVPMPALTGRDHARFAVLCARETFDAGDLQSDFSAWAEGWLAGHDRSGTEARALAEVLEARALRDGGLTHPTELMAGYAARAAQYATSTAWLTGRARDVDNQRAIDLAAEAVRGALRIHDELDLPQLAAEALDDAADAIAVRPARWRPASLVAILRARPT